MAAFSSAAQLRRRPAPVNTSTRRARSDTCISSEIDICRSSKPAPNIIPFTPGAGRCSPDDAYDLPEMFAVRGIVFSHEAGREWEAKLPPALAEDLRRRQRGQVGRSWYVDETSYEGRCVKRVSIPCLSSSSYSPPC